MKRKKTVTMLLRVLGGIVGALVVSIFSAAQSTSKRRQMPYRNSLVQFSAHMFHAPFAYG